MTRFLNQERLILILILAAGFCLRIAGAGFGLPDLLHADEPIVVNHALAYGAGDWNPHFFKIPPLVSYLLFPVYGFYFLIGKLAGIFAGTADFEMSFYRDPSPFYLMARILFGVVLGTATLYFFYRLVRSFFSKTKAVCAAFFLAVGFLHVRESHYVYVDIPLLLVMMLAFFPILRIAKGEGTLQEHVKAGLFIGLATALKYNGGALILPYLYASWRGPSAGRILTQWVVSGLTAAFVFFVLNPYALFDFQFFWHEIHAEAAAHGGVPWFHHLGFSLAGAMSVPLLFFGLMGLLLSFFESNRVTRTVAVFALSYYVILWQWGQPYARYVLPLLPPLFIFASDVVVQVARSLPVPRHLAAGFLMFALGLPTAAHSVLFDYVMMQPDVRGLAKDWVENNIPAGSKIALDSTFYMPRLIMAADQIREKERTLSAAFHAEIKKRKLNYILQLSQTRPSYYLYELSDDKLPEGENFLLTKPRLPFDLEALKLAGIDYVITVRLREVDLHQPFYDELDGKARPLLFLNPYRGNKRQWPYTHPLTGGPFLFQDMVERERNGQPLKIFALE